ncbi:hypothetical protein [Streptomyces corynorhini]|uniref:DUF559 domain-containing protein n=1 Tax=Streptomyces corynorhini TaxID=2282652 RepID=A0A370BHI2_9ACTN|nr:hypothetical protein [Streptomyces corynorhini]RDG39714.1 hypothetical protein DVH02_02115 [Streptomyces corynorhini]
MKNNTPVSLRPLGLPLPLSRLSDDASGRVLSLAQLRAYGVPAGRAAALCRPGGSWRHLLPGVYLLHTGTPTAEERLRGALLYAGRPGAASGRDVPAQPGPRPASGAAGGGGRAASAPYGSAMITGLAALALHGFTESAPPPVAAERIDVLVPRTRRLRSAGYARLIRAHALPRPELIGDLPVAPVARAVADAVAQLSDADSVVALLTEAVRDGHCEPTVVVRELNQSGLLVRPYVVDAVDALLAEGRSLAEGRLYELVRTYGLAEPVWNVDLRLPDGPRLGAVDAYWPERSVAVELDTRAPRQAGRWDEEEDDEQWSAAVRKREHLERLGITVVHLTPKKLRESLEQQATVVRTALLAADDRDPAARVVVLPR